MHVKAIVSHANMLDIWDIRPSKNHNKKTEQEHILLKPCFWPPSLSLLCRLLSVKKKESTIVSAHTQTARARTCTLRGQRSLDGSDKQTRTGTKKAPSQHHRVKRY